MNSQLKNIMLINNIKIVVSDSGKHYQNYIKVSFEKNVYTLKKTDREQRSNTKLLNYPVEGGNF